MFELFEMPFRFVIQYYADDWLFIQKYQFSIDGKAYEFVPDKVDSDNGDGGYIWEWCDQNINSSNVDLIEALANAKEAKIRFVGRSMFRRKLFLRKKLGILKEHLIFIKLWVESFKYLFLPTFKRLV